MGNSIANDAVQITPSIEDIFSNTPKLLGELPTELRISSTNTSGNSA